MTVTDTNKRLPANAEKHLEKFAELLGTAIANADSRAELAASEARARRLAKEQAALRRVATLVAEGAAPTEVFDAVIAEVGELLGSALIGLARYENQHEISVLAIRGDSPEILGAGVRLPLDGDSVNARILRAGCSVRLNFAEEGSAGIAEALRRDNVNATVWAPIVVYGGGSGHDRRKLEEGTTNRPPTRRSAWPSSQTCSPPRSRTRRCAASSPPPAPA